MIRGRSRPTDGIPPILPLLKVQRLEGDELLISENGHPARGVLTGHRQLGEAIARFVERAGGPIRVEVDEADGTSYADILTPHPSPTSPAPTIEDTATTDRVEIAAHGFVPGEDVAIAPIIRETPAGPGGTARALISRDELPAIATEMILFGRASGTVTIERPQRKAARTCPSDLH
jgi:hypothetical protein